MNIHLLLINRIEFNWIQIRRIIQKIVGQTGQETIHTNGFSLAAMGLPPRPPRVFFPSSRASSRLPSSRRASLVSETSPMRARQERWQHQRRLDLPRPHRFMMEIFNCDNLLVIPLVGAPVLGNCNSATVVK